MSLFAGEIFMKNNLTCFPFSSPWIIRYHLANAKTVLDIGCGDGQLMVKVNYDKKYEVTGVDLYRPALRKAKRTGVYKKTVLSDLTKLKFKQKSFDVVLASQVIEHISKKDGLKILSLMEKIAKDKVIISTPNGFVPFEPFEDKDDNPLQIHKSGWRVEEMKKLGYKIYGQGSNFIYRPKGPLYKFRKLKNLLVIASYLLSPIVYFYPNLSFIIIAIKNEEKN